MYDEKSKMIDSHAHLFYSDYKSDLRDVIKRAIDTGIKYIVVPATDLSTSTEAIRLAENYDEIYAAVGIHPHESAKAKKDDLAEIEKLSGHKKVVAIGEIGLDYYYDFSPPTTQQDIFQEMLGLAVARNLPVIVHTRESINVTVAIVGKIVQENPDWRRRMWNPNGTVPPPRGVFHCFSGNTEDAWKVIERGFYVSYPGIITFKNSPVLDTVKSIGYDHLLLETDAPYMTPVPLRGKRNEPTNLHLIANRIAEIFETSVEDVIRTTSFNAKRLFGIGERPEPRIAYQLENSLYLNITIRCNADCVFCDRKGEAVVKGYALNIEKEPSIEEIIKAIGDPRKYKEVVFCGYGEPTIRLDVVKSVATWIKEQGGKVRLNTDGHGNIINKRNIVPELVGIIDVVSISYNTSDPEQYGALMRIDGNKYHRAMTEFTLECKKHLPKVVMTIVDLPEVDLEKAKFEVENQIGVEFRPRPYF